MSDVIEELKRRAGITENEYSDNDAVFQAIDLLSVLMGHLAYLSDRDKKRLAADLQYRDLDIERIKKGLASVGKRLGKGLE